MSGSQVIPGIPNELIILNVIREGTSANISSGGIHEEKDDENIEPSGSSILPDAANIIDRPRACPRSEKETRHVQRRIRYRTIQVDRLSIFLAGNGAEEELACHITLSFELTSTRF